MKNLFKIWSITLFFVVIYFIASIPVVRACIVDSDCADRELCVLFECRRCSDVGIICSGDTMCCKETDACSCQGCMYYCYSCPYHCAPPDCGRVEGSPWCAKECGADACCEGVLPGTYVDSGSCKGYCDSHCNYWSISISASKYHASSGETVTITAVTSLDLPSDYYIRIFEGDNLIKSCSSGNSCSVLVSKSGGEYNYYAKVVFLSPIPPRNAIDIVTSNTITVRWYNISISASKYHASSGETVTITATTTSNLSDERACFACIEIYEIGASLNKIGKVCEGNSYSVQVSHSGGIYNYYAKVVDTVSQDIVTSDTITVRWYNISLSANPSIQKIGNSITLTATSSVDVTYTPYYIRIYEGSNSYPNYIKSCGYGTSCSASVTKNSTGTYTFTAKIENFDGSDVKASASTTVQFVCLSDSDCPSCSSGVLPRCVNNQCRCYNNCGGSYPPCDANHCCTYDIGESPGTCVDISTVRNYGGKSYLCSP